MDRETLTREIKKREGREKREWIFFVEGNWKEKNFKKKKKKKKNSKVHSPFDLVHRGGMLQDGLLSGHFDHALCTEFQLWRKKKRNGAVLIEVRKKYGGPI